MNCNYRKLVCAVVVALMMIPTVASAEPSGTSSTLWSPGFGPWKFDLNVEGGLGKTIHRNRVTGFARARFGVLKVLEGNIPQASPLYLTGGATLMSSDIGLLAIGLQAECMHLNSGLWTQAGGFVDVLKPGPGFAFATGWSLLGAEVQYRFIDEERMPGDLRADWVLYGKLRVPVTIIMSAF